MDVILYLPFLQMRKKAQRRNLPKVVLVRVRAGKWREQAKENFGQQIIRIQWLIVVPTLLFRSQQTLEF